MMPFPTPCHMAKHSNVSATCNTHMMLFPACCNMAKDSIASCKMHNTCMMPFPTPYHMAKHSIASCQTQHLYDAIPYTLPHKAQYWSCQSMMPFRQSTVLRPAKHNTCMMPFPTPYHMAKHSIASCQTQHLYDAIPYTLPHGKAQQSTVLRPAKHNTCMMPFPTPYHMAKHSIASCQTQHLYDAIPYTLPHGKAQYCVLPNTTLV